MNLWEYSMNLWEYSMNLWEYNMNLWEYDIWTYGNMNDILKHNLNKLHGTLV